LSWEENEKKKEYLNGYREAKRREKRILEQIQRLRLDKMFPCLQNDDMPHGHNQSDLSDYAVKMDELMEELKKERLRAVDEYNEIYKTISRLENENEKEVLVRRYINGDKWEEIAVKMNYGYRHIHKIHGSALINIKVPEQTWH
jgi:hypothetical protein